jgi:hypothetical protein
MSVREDNVFAGMLAAAEHENEHLRSLLERARKCLILSRLVTEDVDELIADIQHAQKEQESE